MRREIAQRALGTLENERVEALLDLIDLSLMTKYASNPIQGTLNVEECEYNYNGDCWLNVPDSVTKCGKDCLLGCNK